MRQTVGHIVVCGVIEGDRVRIEPIDRLAQWSADALYVTDDVIPGTGLFDVLEVASADQRRVPAVPRDEKGRLPGHGRADHQRKTRIAERVALPCQQQPQVDALFV